jgi:hypothetical protein
MGTLDEFKAIAGPLEEVPRKLRFAGCQIPKLQKGGKA